MAAKQIPDQKCRASWCTERHAWIPDEVLISETLNHPNLLKQYDIFLDNRTWTLVMEYLPSFLDLFDYVAENGHLSENASREVLAQLLDTTLYLITKKVDHRDNKCENVLYNPVTHKIRLIDFGSIYLPPEFHNTGPTPTCQQ